MAVPGRRVLAAAFAALSLVAVRPGGAAAQRELLGPGAGFITLGITRLTTGELDGWLAARDYPTFGSTGATIGIGGYRVLGRHLLLGLEAQGIVGGEEPHEDGELGLGGGYATLGIGYRVNLSRRLRIYPRLGVGAGGLALWRERQDTADFEVLLANPAPERDEVTVLGRDGAVLDLGAGAEFLPRGGRGPLLGLRLGYLAGPSSSTWESPHRTVRGGPDAALAGPYLRLTLGWAWRN